VGVRWIAAARHLLHSGCRVGAVAIYMRVTARPGKGGQAVLGTACPCSKQELFSVAEAIRIYDHGRST